MLKLSNLIRSLNVTALSLFIAFSVFCLSQPAQAEDIRAQLSKTSTVEQVLQRGVLKVGFSTFVPWAMKNKQGEFIGFEIDVARRLAEDMGVKLELVPTKWSGIIPALLTGKFDVIIGGMTITAERNAKVNFSFPYYTSGMSIVARKDKASGFTSLEDFNKGNVVIVARIGTTAAKAAKKFMPNADIRLFDEEAQATQELLNGNAHAFVSMAPLPAQMAIENSDSLFLPLNGNFTREPNGFAVRKGDVDTLNYFDNWIRSVQMEGWIQERYHYWFETLDWKEQVK